MSDSFVTQDHEEIRQWIEQRGGHPATVTAFKDSDGPGVLRVSFPEPGLQRISWTDFFKKLDDENLALVCQEETADGDTSRFCRFVKAPAGAER